MAVAFLLVIVALFACSTASKGILGSESRPESTTRHGPLAQSSAATFSISRVAVLSRLTTLAASTRFKVFVIVVLLVLTGLGVLIGYLISTSSVSDSGVLEGLDGPNTGTIETGPDSSQNPTGKVDESGGDDDDGDADRTTIIVVGTCVSIAVAAAILLGGRYAFKRHCSSKMTSRHIEDPVVPVSNVVAHEIGAPVSNIVTHKGVIPQTSSVERDEPDTKPVMFESSTGSQISSSDALESLDVSSKHAIADSSAEPGADSDLGESTTDTTEGLVTTHHNVPAPAPSGSSSSKDVLALENGGSRVDVKDASINPPGKRELELPGKPPLATSSEGDNKKLFEFTVGKSLKWGKGPTVRIIHSLQDVDRKFVMKSFGTGKYKSAFDDELKCLKSTLPHPNIVDLCWSGDHAQHGPSIIMEYLKYGDLGKLIGKVKLNNKNPKPILAFIAKSVLQALEHMHSKGFTHNDIRLENIAIAANGAVKLIDFELAGKPSSGGYYLHQPPEAWCSKFGSVTEKLDVYSLGTSLVQLSNVYPLPYNVTDTSIYIQKYYQDLHSPFEKKEIVYLPLPQNIASLGEEDVYRKFLERCLALDPTKRASAAELLEDDFIRLAATGEEFLEFLKGVKN